MLKEYSNEEKVVSLILIISILFLFTDNTSRFFSGVWFFLGVYYIVKEKKYKPKGLEACFLIYIFSQAISILWAKEMYLSWHEFYRHIFGFIPLFTISQIKNLKKIKDKVLDFSMFILTSYYFVYINLQFFKFLPSNSGSDLRYIGFGKGIVVKYAYVIGIQCIYMYFKTLKTKTYKNLYLPALLVNLYLLILAGARGAWLGVLASIVLMTIFYIKNKKITMIGALIILLFFKLISIFERRISYLNFLMNRFKSILNTKTDSSNVARLKMWEVSIEKFKETKFLGLGYKNNLKYNSLGIDFDHPHSDYFYILSSTGIIGILGYFYFLIKVFVISLKNKDRDIWLFILGIIIFLSVYGIVEVLIQTYLTLTITMMMLSFADIGESDE
ncbi:MAG: O-antigen ligase family protein [Fusobacteriaceae bacterium]